MGYDVIGDVHGQSGKLTALLRHLGYRQRNETWLSPAGREAVFLGDLIDRGPGQVETLEIVRRMVDDGRARCIMGNHEFNAIGYVTPGPEGFLRPHTEKNQRQHAAFLAQVGEGSTLHREYVAWFRTLPVTLDLGGLRTVHAWWFDPHVDLIAARIPPGTAMDDEFVRRAHQRGTAEWAAMDGLTKGLEIALPEELFFTDHAGIRRTEARTRWWLENARTYREAAILNPGNVREIPHVVLPDDYRATPVRGSPVCVGHYWMEGTPMIETAKFACLDWSAAKDGPLVSYRWDGEQELDARKLAWV